MINLTTAPHPTPLILTKINLLADFPPADFTGKNSARVSKNAERTEQTYRKINNLSFSLYATVRKKRQNELINHETLENLLRRMDKRSCLPHKGPVIHKESR